MSVFASLRTRTLTIPGTDQTVSLKGVPPRRLEAAQKAHQRKAIQTLKEARADGQDEAFAAVDPAAVEAYQAQVRSTPLLSYDADTLIRDGVTEWTLELPVSGESIQELDEDVRDWMATEVLKLSKPSLFRTVDEQEADRKNG